MCSQRRRRVQLPPSSEQVGWSNLNFPHSRGVDLWGQEEVQKDLCLVGMLATALLGWLTCTRSQIYNLGLCPWRRGEELLSEGYALHLLTCTHWKLFFQSCLRPGIRLVVSYLEGCRTRHHLLKCNHHHRSTVVFWSACQYSTVCSHRCLKCTSVCQTQLKSEKEHLGFKTWTFVLNIDNLQLECCQESKAGKKIAVIYAEQLHQKRLPSKDRWAWISKD